MDDLNLATTHDQAVFEFVINNEGSSILRRIDDRHTLIHSAGLTREQRRFHTWATVCTLGLWFPVYFMVTILRAPRTYCMATSYMGDTSVWEVEHVEILRVQD
jgi:hypothetical protein